MWTWVIPQIIGNVYYRITQWFDYAWYRLTHASEQRMMRALAKKIK